MRRPGRAGPRALGRALAAGAALLAAGGAAAQAGNPQAVSASLDEAARALGAGRHEQARAILTAAAAAGVSGPALERLRADLALASGDPGGALTRYRGLLTARPDDPHLLERAGQAALEAGAVAEASALLERATARADARWSAWNLRGIAADRRGAWAEAEAAYTSAAALAPGEAKLANNHGWSLLLQGRWEEARARLADAVRLDPALGRAARNLALAEAALAADLPTRAPGEGDDSWADRLNDAGVAAQARGQLARARAAFAQALELKGHFHRRAAANLAALDAPAAPLVTPAP